MFSLILMTAMSGAPEAPQFNGYFRDLFNGCRGQSCYGCYGSGTSRSAGCYGSCSGFGSRIRAFFNNLSCYGSGSSRSYACYGSSYSCQGVSFASCYGSSYSCGGGGYGYPPVSDGFVEPAPAVPFAAPTPATPSAYLPGSPGCCGDGYTLGTPAPVSDPYATPHSAVPAPLSAIPAPAAPSPAPPPASVPSAPPASVPENPTAQRVALASPAGSPARGTVVVRLPADAKLFAEGRELTLTSAERTFVTPPLPGGRDYTYTFRAEYVRDGETISQSRRVSVRPGHSAAVEFNDLTLAKGPKPATTPVAATKPAAPGTPTSKPGNPFLGNTTAPTTPTPPGTTERARITVKLPEGASLYVDGKKNDRSERVREFSTPPLNAGQEYAYLMKAEVMRNGRPESQLTKVTFRAGELVTVDFTAAPGR